MKRYQRIEDLRKDLDYSQEEMAKLLFTSKKVCKKLWFTNGGNEYE